MIRFTIKLIDLFVESPTLFWDDKWAEMSTNKGKYKWTVDGMHELGISEWGEVRCIFKVLINFSPDVLDFSVIDRTPPPPIWGC